MLKVFVLINTILIFFYHPAVVIAMMMSMAQAQTNQSIIDNLYWIIPYNFILASVPNLLIVVFYFLTKKKNGLMRVFFIAEMYIVLIHLALYGGVLMLYK